jgi:hypothetical protein
MKNFYALMGAGLILAGLTFADDTTAKQDMKQAGSDVKTAGKATGTATKHAAKGVAKGSKKVVNKGAAATASGASKVEDKTK